MLRLRNAKARCRSLLTVAVANSQGLALPNHLFPQAAMQSCPWKNMAPDPSNVKFKKDGLLRQSVLAFLCSKEGVDGCLQLIGRLHGLLPALLQQPCQFHLSALALLQL